MILRQLGATRRLQHARHEVRLGQQLLGRDALRAKQGGKRVVGRRKHVDRSGGGQDVGQVDGLDGGQEGREVRGGRGELGDVGQVGRARLLGGDRDSCRRGT